MKKNHYYIVIEKEGKAVKSLISGLFISDDSVETAEIIQINMADGKLLINLKSGASEFKQYTGTKRVVRHKSKNIKAEIPTKEEYLNEDKLLHIVTEAHSKVIFDKGLTGMRVPGIRSTQILALIKVIAPLLKVRKNIFP